MLDFPTRTIQTQSAPENAGTKQLGDQWPGIEQFKIETVQLTDTQIITQTENYYFDVSVMIAARQRWLSPPVIVHHHVSGLAFHFEIGWLHFDSTVNYESPGLGYSLCYTAPGINADLYVYGRGLAAIPGDVTDSVVRDGFERAAGEIAAALSVVCIVGAASANQDSLWTYNDSIMYLVAEGQVREFRYQEPRPALIPFGVTRGTLAFRGFFRDGEYVGTAFNFSRECGALAFSVSILDKGKRILLAGRLPTVDAWCRNISSIDHELEFRALKGIIDKWPPETTIQKSVFPKRTAVEEGWRHVCCARRNQ
jgi:hypothetical protein